MLPGVWLASDHRLEHGAPRRAGQNRAACDSESPGQRGLCASASGDRVADAQRLETALLAEALKGLIQVKRPGAPPPNIKEVLRLPDEGERQAILLARSFTKPVLLFRDDRVGRIAARKLGQPLAGLAGLLLLAKQRRLVTAVIPLLLVVRKGGYWVADDVIEVVRKLAVE